MFELLSMPAALGIGGGLGGLLVVIGWIWLVVMGFQDSVLWGILNLLLFPILAIVFGAMHWPKTQVPLVLLIVGLVLGGAGAGGLS